MGSRRFQGMGYLQGTIVFKIEDIRWLTSPLFFEKPFLLKIHNNIFTMLSPQSILSLLKKNELPEYAVEKKSLLSAIFSKKDWYKTMELGNRIFNTNMGDYSSQQMAKFLTQLVHSEKSIFSFTNVEFLEFKEEYKYLISNHHYLHMAFERYLVADRVTGLDYKYLRYLLFLAVLPEHDYNVKIPNHIAQKFPKEYQAEICLIFVLGKLKAGKIKKAFRELEFFPRIILKEEGYFNKYFNEFFKILMTEANLGYTHATEQAITFYQQAKEEVGKKNHLLDWQEFKDITTDQFSFFPKALELEDEVLIEFCKVVLINDHHQLWQKLTYKRESKYMDLLMAKVNWNEDQIINFIIFCIKPNETIKLPKGIIKAAKVLLENGSIKTLEALWAYYPQTKGKHIEDKNVLKLLQEFATLRETQKKETATFDQLILSGFEPIRPGYNQNVYKGMSPEQVRPFFRLLQEVADVDIVKFYQDREKMKFVRFQIKGEQYDLQTTNGLGISIINPINTLLFENEIPYQFILVNRSGAPGSYSGHNMLWSNQRVTLVNEKTYAQHRESILGPSEIKFAKSDEPANAFVKRIEEIKPVTLKTDLDQIDLKKDPKFRVIRGELDKLLNLPVWTKLLIQSLRFPLDRKPSKTWQKLATEIVEELGAEDFQSGHLMILEKLIIGDEWFQDTEKVCALRGLTWLSRMHPGNGQLYMVQKIANRAYKKVPGGPLNAKLGNIALETLAAIGNLDAFGIINNIEAKAKYSVYKRAIAARKKKFTKLLEQFTPEELADRSVPSHELINGKKTIEVGDVKALLQLNESKVNITWETTSGKIQKTVPAHLKTDFAAEIKSVKAEGKSIVETINSQARKFEKSWIQQRTWALDNWKKFILSHGLLNVVCEKLIWIMENNGVNTSFMIQYTQPIDYQGNTIELTENASIRLWHPSLVSVEETLAWRNRIFDQQIKQPFKQAFREVYLLTPAEELTNDHSNRFAGHHLRGNTLYSLGKNREWKMTYEEAPTFDIPSAELVAILNIRGGVLYSDCDTLDLQFRRRDSNRKGQGYFLRDQVPLTDVPPVILSEVMRDVDLFVAVAGLGVDPYFDQNQTGELMNYWRDASFGRKSQTAMSEIRKDLLGRLIPMTKIAKKCSFEDNFLKVVGTFRTYKINLGSGNILMEPNDQYLCIVPAPNSRLEKKIWLPFEGGDKTLMVILSKAFLLADDEKISDQSILYQIKRK